MKKAFLFIFMISCAISCFAFSFPPSNNLVYSHHEYGNDKVIITRDKDLGSYSWHFGKGYGSSSDYDWFYVSVVTSEVNIKLVGKYPNEIVTSEINTTKKRIHVYYQPEGYTNCVLDEYYMENGKLMKVYHDIAIPVYVPENRNDWTAYHKTVEDYYDYWLKGLPPKKEIE